MFPDFLCIGAPRSGTTWLYENLKQHPEIWLTPVKEIHFFNYYLDNPSPLRACFNKWSWHRKLIGSIGQSLAPLDISGLKWSINYFFKPYTVEWYASIFEPGRDKKTGDFTPAYSTLDLNLVAYVHKLMPHAKIIFLMRNPIDRAWSQVGLLSRKRRINLDDEEEIITLFKSQYSILRGNYLRTIRNWKTYYPDEQFFIGFFEEIPECPEELLLRLYRFLGIIASRGLIPETVRKKYNYLLGPSIPQKVAACLADMYYEDIKALHKIFGGYTGNWLECAEKIIKGQSVSK